MSVNILTYMLAASLIQGGMNWKQAVMTIFLGNVIVLVPMLLNSHPGAKYGVPFPVLARASFGVLGANVAAVLRALVACGWFGSAPCWPRSLRDGKTFLTPPPSAFFFSGSSTLLSF